MDESFKLPEVLAGASGRTRRAGFELEFAGIGPERAARAVADAFGGSLKEVNNFQILVQGTGLGDFEVEMDALVLKDRRYASYLEQMGIRLSRDNMARLEKTLLDLSTLVVPCEIVTPPLPVDGLAPMEELRERLREAKAKGTKASPAYAFGLHINLEPPDMDAHALTAFMKAYLLLEPWLREREEVDFTRIVSPFIKSFPGAYARLVLREGYSPDLAGFIDDYLKHNPTRNRSLDLLPLLAHLDEKRVFAADVEKDLVKPRPAYHFRLPNCRVGDPGWRIADAYNRLLTVEKLSRSPGLLEKMERDWRDTPGFPLSLFTDDWTQKAEAWVESGLS